VIERLDFEPRHAILALEPADSEEPVSVLPPKPVLDLDPRAGLPDPARQIQIVAEDGHPA
jgi:hypothetical protein